MARPATDASMARGRINVTVGLLDQVSGLDAVIDEFRIRRIDLVSCRLVTTRESSIFSEELTLRHSGLFRVERIPRKALAAERVWWEDIVLLQPPAIGNAVGLDRSALGHDREPPALMRQNQRMIQHLDSGGGVLIVALEDQAEHQAIAGLLLRLASAVVTHQTRARSLLADSAPRHPAMAPRTTECQGELGRAPGRLI